MTRAHGADGTTDPETSRGPTIDITSFGFKHGAMEADLVVDVRFAANPFYVAALKPLTGRDPECAAYVLGHEGMEAYVESLAGLAAGMHAAFGARERKELRIAVGCTGGQHRSVAVVEAVAGALRRGGFSPVVRHRELDRHHAHDNAKSSR